MTDTVGSGKIRGNHSATSFLFRESGVLLLLISEIILIAPWILIFRYPRQPSLILLIILLALAAMATMAIRRVLKVSHLPKILIQVLTLAALPAASYAVIYYAVYRDVPGAAATIEMMRSFTGLFYGIPIEVALILLTLFAWSRGVRAAVRGMTDLMRTGSLIRRGILSFLVLMLVLGNMGEQLRVWLTIFFFTSLLSTALSRTELISRSHVELKLAVRPGWWGEILMLTLLTTILGASAGLLLQSDTVLSLVDSLKGVFSIVVKVLELIIAPVIYFSGMMFSVLLRWLSPYINAENMFSPEDGMDSDIPGMPFGDAMLGEDGTLSPEFITGLAIAVVMMTAVMVLWGLRRRSMNDRDSAGELEIDRSDRDPLLNGLQRLYDNFRDQLREVSQIRGIRRIVVGSSIRWIYAQLLRFGARNNFVREDSETPNEYQERLISEFPHLEDDFRRITDAFTEIRYGEIPEEPGAIQAVREAWEHIKAFR